MLSVVEQIYNNKEGLLKAICKLNLGKAHILIFTIVKKAFSFVVRALTGLCRGHNPTQNLLGNWTKVHTMHPPKGGIRKSTKKVPILS